MVVRKPLSSYFVMTSRPPPAAAEGESDGNAGCDEIGNAGWGVDCQGTC